MGSDPGKDADAGSVWQHHGVGPMDHAVLGFYEWLDHPCVVRNNSVSGQNLERLRLNRHRHYKSLEGLAEMPECAMSFSESEDTFRGAVTTSTAKATRL